MHENIGFHAPWGEKWHIDDDFVLLFQLCLTIGMFTGVTPDQLDGLCMRFIFRIATKLYHLRK